MKIIEAFTAGIVLVSCTVVTYVSIKYLPREAYIPITCICGVLVVVMGAMVISDIRYFKKGKNNEG